MAVRTTIKEQLQRNTVALISLVIAVTSLGYNTWRNEASEYNRNQRLVSIEVLRNLGQLQQVVFHRHYDMDETDKGNARTGWAIVLTITDLATVLEEPLPAAAEDLRAVWDDDWQKLGSDQLGSDRIIAAVEALRMDVHALLKNLD
jgi:hypothetical protein